MKVFLSYTAPDRELARQLSTHLQKEGLLIWDPDVEVFPGDNWAKVIGKALESSDAMVALVTPNSLDSDWFAHDVSYALSHEQYAWRLIPVLSPEVKNDLIGKVHNGLTYLKQIKLPNRSPQALKAASRHIHELLNVATPEVV